MGSIGPMDVNAQVATGRIGYEVGCGFSAELATGFDIRHPLQSMRFVFFRRKTRQNQIVRLNT
ncbi:hypothetical protein BLL52_3493 [Rhodoferax antarcticus ANT.BR]|uniref:Uncharacterized protein n=1 Tax=Rhodoferax antarcticus ANT.BR TaxID=1111071 RepID=A0A1Q8YBI8_9BURK|nr:hypothetical protein BLL52_3493 [Rhodoferax antarcticus ANT.BR]